MAKYKDGYAETVATDSANRLRPPARITHKLGHRLDKITFHTFRHWKATMEYAKTRDISIKCELLKRNITLQNIELLYFLDRQFTYLFAKSQSISIETHAVGSI